jgi:hypothetical protein
MEKDYGQRGPHIVQIRRFREDSTNYWENVIGYVEEAGKEILAGPDGKPTTDEALELFGRVNPSRMSANHRIIHWHRRNNGRNFEPGFTNPGFLVF